jgi:hypothetical protein
MIEEYTLNDINILGVVGIVNDSSCPTLSWEQRLTGFGICAVLGVLLSFLGPIFLLFHDIMFYAISYTVGNIISIASYVLRRLEY